MHDIWNPWHGCVKISEGCDNCYMYFLDRKRDKHGADIYKTRNFYYPLQKKRDGSYLIKSGEIIRVCMTSDFFMEEADQWRGEAWSIMKERPDVIFYLLTKRPERVAYNLPKNWGDGWENIYFNVTCENQKRADERLPILLDLPFKHKGIMCAPLIGPIELSKYLIDKQVEQVITGGENYDGSRPCNFDWIKSLAQQCRDAEISFYFTETGTIFIKDGKKYKLKGKELQNRMAYKSGVNFTVKKMKFNLTDNLGFPIRDEELYKPQYIDNCRECSSREICNGCSRCGNCGISF